MKYKIENVQKIIVLQMMILYLCLFVSLSQAQDEWKYFKPLCLSSRWVPEENKLVCLAIKLKCAKPEILGQVLILDAESKTFRFVKIPNFYPSLSLYRLLYLRESKEILLMGGPPGKYEVLQLIGFQPFSNQPDIRTLLYLSDGTPSISPDDIKLMHKNIILLSTDSKLSTSYARRCASLTAYDMDKNTSHTLRSDVRSENLVMTQGGNLYFLSEKGIQRYTNNLTSPEMVLNCMKVRGLTTDGFLKDIISRFGSAYYLKKIQVQDWTLGYMFNYMDLFISPDETTAIIHMYTLSDEPEILYSLYLREKRFLKKIIGVSASSLIFTPDSKKILISSSKGIDVYDTSLNKLSTLIKGTGNRVVSCDSAGFVIFRMRHEEDKTESSETSYPYEFTMHNWEGELLFKFEHE